jgi:hypothetical protein
MGKLAPGDVPLAVIANNEQAFQFDDACDEGDKSAAKACELMRARIGGMEAVVKGEDPELAVPEQWAKLYELYKAIRIKLLESCSEGKPLLHNPEFYRLTLDRLHAPPRA